MTSNTTYLYLHPESINQNEIMIFGLEKENSEFVQANLKDLQHELYTQKRLMEIEDDVDGELSYWEGILIIEEGRYKWNPSKEEYELTT